MEVLLPDFGYDIPDKNQTLGIVDNSYSFAVSVKNSSLTSKLVSLFVLSLCCFYLYFAFNSKRRRIEKYLQFFQGPPRIPILGNVLSLNVPDTEYTAVFQRFRERYGNVYRMWQVHRPWVVLMSAENVGKILSSTVHIDKSEEYEVFKPWFGNGIESINGDGWRKRRKLLQPTYNFKRFDDFINIANIHSRTLMEILENKCNTTFDMSHYIKRCSLDIICEMATGTRKNLQREPECKYIRALESNVGLMMYRLVRPWLLPAFIWNLTGSGRQEKRNIKILHKFTKNEIKERRRLREMNKIAEEKLDISSDENSDVNAQRKLMVFIDYLLDLADRNKEYTDEHIQEDVDAFVFAGFDTTAQSINFSLYLLACDPVHQARVQQELDEIFGNDRNRAITSNDLSKMKYLDLCIKESLRLYPSGPFFMRDLHEDCKLDDGRIIPSGCTILIAAYHLHRDPNVFPEPEVFDPERFLPENCEGRHPYAYVPFANGPRNCMGQKMAMLEEKIIISRILLNYNLATKQKREDLTLHPTIVLQVEEGFQIQLTKRTF